MAIDNIHKVTVSLLDHEWQMLERIAERKNLKVEQVVMDCLLTGLNNEVVNLSVDIANEFNELLQNKHTK